MTNYNIFSKDFWEHNSAKDGAIATIIVIFVLTISFFFIIRWIRLKYNTHKTLNDAKKNTSFAVYCAIPGGTNEKCPLGSMKNPKPKT